MLKTKLFISKPGSKCALSNAHYRQHLLAHVLTMLSGFNSWKSDCLLIFQAGPHKPAAFFPQWQHRMSLFIWICICSGTWPIKVQVYMCLYMLRRHTGVEVELHLLTSALDGSEWLTLWPNLFIPEKGLGTHWVGPKPVWKFWRREKSLVLTGIRTPDCEALNLVTIPYH